MRRPKDAKKIKLDTEHLGDFLLFGTPSAIIIFHAKPGILFFGTTSAINLFLFNT
jgi:hypothetical protein